MTIICMDCDKTDVQANANVSHGLCEFHHLQRLYDSGMATNEEKRKYFKMAAAEVNLK